ncbi:DUF805 domain-containing protein [Demequina rhizosphaerae]|uniref:DUF805 domain-containing protein n=1 Tax=Demequina rhizosphaerae TaxID=1638985 RepID=UPI0007840615|nr:DUF805 domain-containing protein [Demequina rhizosphaerae]
MDGFRTALSKYAQFQGRSRRREYWGFMIVVWLIAIAIGLLYALSWAMVADSGDGNWLAAIALILGIGVGLALIVPTLSVGWRRCQDVGIPGAVALIGIAVPLVVYVIGLIPGNEGPNEYGPDPKA